MSLDPPYWTLDPEKLMKACTSKTKAIVLNRFEDFFNFVLKFNNPFVVQPKFLAFEEYKGAHLNIFTRLQLVC